MKENASRFVRIAAGLLCLVTVAWVLTGHAARPTLEGVPTDWTHRHVIFSQPSTPLQAGWVANDARFWQQEYRRSAARVMSNSAATPHPEFVMRVPGLKTAGARSDWSQNLGPLASVGAGNYPAKYGFRTTIANCASTGSPDFVVFGTGLLDLAGQASIVAYDNLYSGCTGTVPSVYWAYRTGGQVTTSPVFSGDGTQIAFVQTNGFSVGTLVLLKWKSSTTQSVSSPATPALVGLNAYFSCPAPCMTTIPLMDGLGFQTNDLFSSVFYDYQSDTAWVGDSAGWLHKFNRFFKGTPAEIRTAPWPVQVNPGNPIDLSSPVHDLVSDNVFVGDMGGFFARVNATTGVVTLANQIDQGAGIVAGPIVDSTAQKVYVSSSNDGSASCAGGPCSAVYVFATNFAANTSGTEVTVGTGSTGATPAPMYDGGFDSAYQASNATGNLYVCGNTGGAPTLYQVPITAGVMGTPVAGAALATAATTCSPVMDIPNPNATGGGSEWIFASVQNNGAGNSCGGTGCVMNFITKPWQPGTYVVGQRVIDSHFQVQVVATGGLSRANTPPNWTTTIGGQTSDNVVRWRNQGVQTAFYAAWAPNTRYFSASHTEILDSNGNIEVVIAGGRSRTAAQGHPVWNTAIAGNTTDNTVTWRNLGPVATTSLAASGGTSGMIIDNKVGTGTQAGASQIYFSTLGNQACGTSGTGGCAVQASQSALQ